LSPIQHILGLDEDEERAISWLNEWTKERNYDNYNNNDPSYEPLSECQLDALRYLGSPESACGVLCNITDYSGIVPEPCGLFENASLDELWNNTYCKLRCLVNIYQALDQATLTLSND
jgi:hypothetical protein